MEMNWVPTNSYAAAVTSNVVFFKDRAYEECQTRPDIQNLNCYEARTLVMKGTRAWWTESTFKEVPSSET